MKKVNAPANLYMNDERFALVHTDAYDPIIVVGFPGSRSNLSSKEARRFLSWLQKAVAFAEWREGENRRIEREENQ